MPASFPLCFGLGFLADEVENPQPLVVGTYARLFDELGGKVTPATLQKMIDAKDPYAVPDQGNTDLAALQGRMREFRNLLGKRGWAIPATSDRLLADLTERLRASSGQQVAVAKAKRETERGYTIQLPMAWAMKVSPNGGHVATVMSVRRGEGRLVSFDLSSRQRIEGSSPYSGGHVHFSADGTHLVFDRSGQIYRVPFNGGHPKWNTAEQIGNLPDLQKVWALLPAADGVRFYTRHQTDSGALVTYLSVLGDGPSVKIELPAVEWSSDWGIIPGSDGLWVLAMDKTHGVSVTDYVVSSTGEAKPRGHWTFESRNLMNAIWAPDGKTVMGYGREGNSAIELVATARPSFDGPAPAVQRLELPRDTSGDPVSIFDAKAHPKENKAAFLVNDKAGRRHLVWYGFKTGKSLGETPIPELAFTNLFMDPSGKHFLLSSPEGQVYVGNLDSAPQ